MNIQEDLKTAIQQAIQTLYGMVADEVVLQPTKKEFEGVYTYVTFPLTKPLRQSPAAIGQAIGQVLVDTSGLVSRFNVVQGFLNLVIADAVWLRVLDAMRTDASFGTLPARKESVMVEFSSPNTNKPLHLGHLRNNFLGDSVSRILVANGYDVVKTCLVNDRGIHICKSMLAYQRFGEGETPESSGMKGDHLVGKYYVLFDKELKRQVAKIWYDIYYMRQLKLFDETEKEQILSHLNKIEQLENKLKIEEQSLDWIAIESLGEKISITAESISDGNHKWNYLTKVIDDKDQQIREAKQRKLHALLKPVLLIEEEIDAEEKAIKDIAQSKVEIMLAVQQMLRQWEQGDPDILALWQKLNNWVYAGFAETYRSIGVSFDKTYYESNTYLLGKDVIDEGLATGVFYRKPDNSVWIDLTAEGLDQKLVLRADGTSVYITQDLGTTDLKVSDFHNNRLIWVVGNEQDYHFNVLFAIMRRLGRPYANGLYHLSYGMVDLPSGKMKSREGTVVDADDLVQEVIDAAAQAADDAVKGDLNDFRPSKRRTCFG